ncbi:DUF4214 domain-containing protein, partial [Pseudoduganella ginsengisoli]
DKGSTVASIAADFAKSPEYQALYEGKSNVDLIKAVYQNLFGRAAEASGAEYWAGVMKQGYSAHATVGLILAAASETDKRVVDNKTEAAAAFTAALDTATESTAYTRTPAKASASAWLNGVTTDASLAQAKAGIDKAVSAAVGA